jgi:hypothetical protein
MSQVVSKDLKSCAAYGILQYSSYHTGGGAMPVLFELKEGNERLTSHSGLALVGALLGRTHLKQDVDQVVLPVCVHPEILHSNIIQSMVGLLCSGKTQFEAIEPFRQDPFFAQSLDLDACPASATLRQRMDFFGDALNDMIKRNSAELIRNTAQTITPITTSIGDFVPLDIDVSPHDNENTKKEGVSYTYKGVNGYAPSYAYLGQEGFMVNAELRPGKQHCQNGTPEFLREALQYSQTLTSGTLLVRLDSGYDSQDNLHVCIDEQSEWLIKRNLRKESPEQWLAVAKAHGTARRVRTGKTIWRGTIDRVRDGFDEPLRIVFDVTETTITAQGQTLITPEIEVDTYWASLDLPADELIGLYHDHGTSEQFHSEIKTDLDLERLPSKYYQTNALVLLLGMLSYNILRLCGQESLREDNGNVDMRPAFRRIATRRRVRTVIQDLICLAGRVTYGQRKVYLSFGQYCPWERVWKRLYQRFMQPVAAAVS